MIEDAYPLAALQAGMLYHSELDTGGSTYHDLMTITVRGGLDAAALERALAEAAARHPVLRTSFDLTGFSEPLQLVHDAAVIRWRSPTCAATERGSGWPSGGRRRSAPGSTGRLPR